jgi:hypothetical protein
MHVVQGGAEQSRSERGAADTDQDADDDRAHRMTKDKPHHLAGPCTERESDSKFARPLRDGIGDDAI